MKKRILSLFLVLSLMLPLMTFGASAGFGPSSADLDEIDATCDYPKNSDYLDKYEVMYVKGSQNSSVYCLHGLNDGANWKSKAIAVSGGTDVTVIAIHSYKSGGKTVSYACCRFIDYSQGFSAGPKYLSGWINMDYLESETAYCLSDANFGTGSHSISEPLDDLSFSSFFSDERNLAPLEKYYDIFVPSYYDDGILKMSWEGIKRWGYYDWDDEELWLNRAKNLCIFEERSGPLTGNEAWNIISSGEGSTYGDGPTLDAYCDCGTEEWFASTVIPYDKEADFEEYVVDYIDTNIYSWISGYSRLDNMEVCEIPYDTRNNALVLFYDLRGEGYQRIKIFVPVLIDFGGTYGIPVYYFDMMPSHIHELFARCSWD